MKKFNLIIYILITIVFSSCTYYLFRKTPNWWENRKYTHATIYKSIDTYGNILFYTFTVEGVDYNFQHVTSVNRVSHVPGTKYQLIYNPKNPEQHYFVFLKPLFLESESTSFTIGEIDYIGEMRDITNIDSSGFVHQVTFKYKVYDTEYMATAFSQFPDSVLIANNYKLKSKDFEGKKYKVQYWEIDPQRSIILLD